ncbi:MAG: PD40 domain-containing protein [Verrucomicrobia bacterium]|nr:PD40 domain-containing protein [Verrucomicrobiota bacterium]
MNTHLTAQCVLRTLVGFLAGVSFMARAQSPKLNAPRLTPDRAVEISLTGSAEKTYRIDASTNLTSWSPLGILRDTNLTKVLIDRALTNLPQRFYRAREVQPLVTVTEVSPLTGRPGTRVEILGQFFEADRPKDNWVTFEGTAAQVIEASMVRLVVAVPTNASSGFIQVRTPLGTARGTDAFMVSGIVEVRVQPPTGMSSVDFVVVNTLGQAAAVSPSITVRQNSPLLTMAVPKEPSSFAVLYGVSLTSTQALSLSVESTAQALVFMNPAFATLDPLLAERTLSIILQDPAVRQFARLLGELYPQPGDPFTRPSLVAAYREAVISVSQGASMRALAESVRRRNSRQLLARPQFSSGDYPLDIEFVEIADSQDGKPLGGSRRLINAGVGPRFPYLNPVDWTVVIQEIHVDRAFPNGRPDFNLAWRDKRTLEKYPVRSLPFKPRNVTATLITERFNPVKFLTGALADLLKESWSGPEEPLEFEPRDAIYIVRAIGPSFGPPDEARFVFENFQEERIRSVAANLVAATMDLLSVMIDGAAIEVKEDRELMAKLLLEAIKKESTFKEPGDLPGIAVDLLKFVLQELVDKFKAEALETAAQQAFKRGTAELAKRLNLVGSTLKFLDVIGGAGQVIQRMSGLVATTPMETAFLVVGDPFQLEIYTIEPSAAAPGAQIKIGLRSSAGRLFDPQNGQDRVSFEGPDYFDAKVSSVSGTTTNQILLAELPVEPTVVADGSYVLIVNLQGRQGRAPFQISSKPEVTALAPGLAFAAVADFLGRPFDGTPIRITGLNFAPTDTFLFSGVGGSIEATDKSGAAGDVTVRVPKGALSGPITIRISRNNSVVEIQTPRLEVLGTPVIHSLSPGAAKLGETIVLSGSGVDAAAGPVFVQFTGASPETAGVRGTNILVGVPFGAKTGPVVLITPAGRAERSFALLPGIGGGGTVEVGGDSVISLGSALAFIKGDATPLDDADRVENSDGSFTFLDPPREEGDYVTDRIRTGESPRFPVGRGFADTIRVSGTVSGDGVLASDYDLLRGAGVEARIVGNLTVSASYAEVSGITIDGDLIVSGNHNLIGGVTVLGQFIVLGHQNTVNSVLRHSRGHGLVVRGQANRLRLTCHTNAGDGLRIEGGKLNTVEVNGSSGNGGNGITLTDGADENDILFHTGLRDAATRRAARDTGNRAHGIALLGEARRNRIRLITLGCAGNGGDGAHLDGPGVSENTFENFQTYYNRGNGITVANGAIGNRFGSADFETPSLCLSESNDKNGVFVNAARRTEIAVHAYGNKEHGLLISGLVDETRQTKMVLTTTGFGMIRGNAKAGLRLEKRTTGLELITPNPGLENNRIGLEMEGAEVTNNTLRVYIDNSVSHGAVLTGVQDNEVTLDVEASGGHGIVLDGAKENVLRLYDCTDNPQNGILITGGASDNRITAAFSRFGLGFTALVTRSRNGIVLDKGARRNLIEEMTVSQNKEFGILLQDTATDANQIAACFVLESGLDGVRIQGGASQNIIGLDRSEVQEPLIFGAFKEGGVNFERNKSAAVRIAGLGTRGNIIQHGVIKPNLGTQEHGIIVEDEAADTTVANNDLSDHLHGVIVRDRARNTFIRGNRILSSTQAGILVSNAVEVFIGGPLEGDRNEVAQSPIGIQLTGERTQFCEIRMNHVFQTGTGILLAQKAPNNRIGPGNVIINNTVGVSVSGALSNVVWQNSIRTNKTAGILIDSGGAQNQVVGNFIMGNGTGVRVSGGSALGNAILANSITGNALKGIQLTEGGNRLLQAPTVLQFQGSSLTGAAEAPDQSLIEVYRDSADEGQQLLAKGRLTNRRFRISLENVDPNQVNVSFQINATVTAPDHNTSEFGGPFRSNQLRLLMAFTSTRDGNHEIYLQDSASPMPRRLTVHPAEDTNPKLSSDGSNVVFVSNREGNREIYLLSTSPGALPTRLTSSPEADYSPVWSPTRLKIYFVSERDGLPAIFRMNPNGAEVERVTPVGMRAHSPAVSADGSKIAFVSDRSGNPDIWLINSDGTGLRALTTSPAPELQPTWSPEGQQVAFVSLLAGDPEIYALALDGSRIARLTDNRSEDLSPHWLPGGQQILFSSNRDEGFELYQIPMTGGDATRISVSQGDNMEPSAALISTEQQTNFQP